MENKPANIENRVMDKIKSGRIKLRSRYIFLAEKLSIGSVFILSALLAILFFNLALFYLRASDNLAYLSFGSRGFFAFLESFPYLLVAVFVLLIFVAGFLVKKSEWSYKKPFGYVAVGLIALVIIFGSVLALTNIAEQIERGAFGRHTAGKFFRPFFEHGLMEKRRGEAGRVIEVSENYAVIQTPRGLQKIDLGGLEDKPDQLPAVGSFIMAVGERKDDVFIAYGIRVVNEKDLPMIRRGVRRRFGDFQKPSLPMMDFGHR